MTRSGIGESERIGAEYERRAREIPAGFYSWNKPVNYFFHTQICRQLIRGLSRRTVFPLDGCRILDVGCGTGTWLLKFAQWGAHAERLSGIDLGPARIDVARRKLPGADLRAGDAAALPWADASMDLVSQFVMFTSILDVSVQRRIASEMIRVLKPGGFIVWYDFRVNNPRNHNVLGIRKSEVRRLFPGCAVSLESITLAPPVARRVVPLSWPAALLFERIPFLRTHYLGFIGKPELHT